MPAGSDTFVWHPVSGLVRSADAAHLPSPSCSAAGRQRPRLRAALPGIATNQRLLSIEPTEPPSFEEVMRAGQRRHRYAADERRRLAAGTRRARGRRDRPRRRQRRPVRRGRSGGHARLRGSGCFRGTVELEGGASSASGTAGASPRSSRAKTKWAAAGRTGSQRLANWPAAPASDAEEPRAAPQQPDRTAVALAPEFARPRPALCAAAHRHRRRGDALPSALLTERSVNFNLGRLGGGRAADYWDLSDDYRRKLASAIANWPIARSASAVIAARRTSSQNCSATSAPRPRPSPTAAISAKPPSSTKIASNSRWPRPAACSAGPLDRSRRPLRASANSKSPATSSASSTSPNRPSRRTGRRSASPPRGRSPRTGPAVRKQTRITGQRADRPDQRLARLHASRALSGRGLRAARASPQARAGRGAGRGRTGRSIRHQAGDAGRRLGPRDDELSARGRPRRRAVRDPRPRLAKPACRQSCRIGEPVAGPEDDGSRRPPAGARLHALSRSAGRRGAAASGGPGHARPDRARQFAAARQLVPLAARQLEGRGQRRRRVLCRRLPAELALGVRGRWDGTVQVPVGDPAVVPAEVYRFADLPGRRSARPGVDVSACAAGQSERDMQFVASDRFQRAMSRLSRWGSEHPLEGLTYGMGHSLLLLTLPEPGVAQVVPYDVPLRVQGLRTLTYSVEALAEDEDDEIVRPLPSSPASNRFISRWARACTARASSKPPRSTARPSCRSPAPRRMPGASSWPASRGATCSGAIQPRAPRRASPRTSRGRSSASTARRHVVAAAQETVEVFSTLGGRLAYLGQTSAPGAEPLAILSDD